MVVFQLSLSSCGVICPAWFKEGCTTLHINYTLNKALSGSGCVQRALGKLLSGKMKAQCEQVFFSARSMVLGSIGWDFSLAMVPVPVEDKPPLAQSFWNVSFKSSVFPMCIVWISTWASALCFCFFWAARWISWDQAQHNWVASGPKDSLFIVQVSLRC